MGALQTVRKIGASVGGAILLLGYMAALAVALPFIKLALFHYQAWSAWRRGDRAVGVVTFLLGCAPFDIGLIWMATLIARGDLPIW